MSHDSIPKISEQIRALYSPPQYYSPNEVKYAINADYLKYYLREECYRELMVSYIPMIPLLEKTVRFEEADYILYMHMYARCDDMSDYVVQDLRKIAARRKEGAEIIVVGKAANAEKILNGSISNITFWGDHFCEKLGKRFGFDIKEQYFVWDDNNRHLAIWPVDGCLQKCGFCRRTYMDIKFESLSLDTIKSQLDYIKSTNPERLKVISLRAENLTEYGIDIYGVPMLHKLIDLLEEYNEIEELRIPIGFAIGECTPEILESLVKSTKLKAIALNLETGSDRLLKLIGKKHTREKAIYIFDELRQAHPDLYIESTVMLGLPTEGVDDIYQLAELIDITCPNHLLINFYTMASKHPLAKLPQLTNSCMEYHLKTLLKYLRYSNTNREGIMTFRCQYVPAHPKTRRYLREKRKLDEQNEMSAQNGLLPRHFVSRGRYARIKK